MLGADVEARVGFGAVVVGACAGAGALLASTTVWNELGLTEPTVLTGPVELFGAAPTPPSTATGLCSGIGWLHGR